MQSNPDSGIREFLLVESRILVDHEKSPFFLRDTRATETRARMKIKSRKKGETRGVIQ